MEAACRGAAGAGGLTVGLLPGVDRAAANSHVRLPVATGLGELRNALVVRTSDVVIAVGGAYGTLSEVALALKMGIVVVGLGTWGLVRPDGAPDSGVLVAADPEDALNCAFRAVGRPQGEVPRPRPGRPGTGCPVAVGWSGPRPLAVARTGPGSVGGKGKTVTLHGRLQGARNWRWNDIW